MGGASRKLRAGADNAITDVPGIEVGHFSDLVGLTGVTTILCREGAVTGVDVRGAAPGTRETDLLEPGNLVQKVQAIVLAGGSAFGLDAAAGVMRFLEERGHGQVVAEDRVVPIVPAAVLFDLDVGSWESRPTAEHGYLAAENASSERPAMGNVGAGTGAKAAGVKGGLGSASAVFENGLIVGALVVVNSAGRTFDPEAGGFFARDLELGQEFGQLGIPQGEARRAGSDYSELIPDSGSRVGGNTTIGVVATNALLDKAQVRILARASHDGMARAIRPAHTVFDGDTIFAMATGEQRLSGPAEQARLGAVAGDVFSRAVVHAMLAAQSVSGLKSYCDLFPRLCGRES